MAKRAKSGKRWMDRIVGEPRGESHRIYGTRDIGGIQGHMELASAKVTFSEKFKFSE